VKKAVAAGLAVALAASTCVAQEISFETVAARYVAANAYCESGKWGMRIDPKHPFTETSFRLCARRDGRFKYEEYSDPKRVVANWTEDGRLHRYSEYGGFYRQYAPGDPVVGSLFGYRPEDSPGLQSRLFAWDSRRISGIESTPTLGAYRPSAALTTAGREGFERAGAWKGSVERLWVAEKERAIVRYEEVRDGAVMRYVELASHAFDRPLTEEQLAHEVPFTARYSLQNHPSVFFAGLAAAAVAAGLLAWGWLFARTGRIDDVQKLRRRAWKVQLWALLVTAAVLGALALLTAGTSSGHPPAIVYVMVIAIWCAVAFGLAALFTLASYPVELVLAAIRAGRPGTR
jgi:hypothetical protein